MCRRIKNEENDARKYFILRNKKHQVNELLQTFEIKDKLFEYEEYLEPMLISMQKIALHAHTHIIQ